MSKNKTLKRYILKVDFIVASVIILSYTILINIYFMFGLDEGNYQDLHLEAISFSQAYNKHLAPKLPKSIHFNGYLNWQTLPDWAQKQFPELAQVTQTQMSNVKLKPEGNLIAWPEQVIFILAKPLNDGKTFYLIRKIDIETYQALSKRSIKNMFKLTWPLALLFLIMMHLSVHVLLKRTMKPLFRLGTWIDDLTLENVSDPIPDFDFKEFKHIAKQQKIAMLRISDVLSKEQDFLRHASHELRTPIAVVKSNAQLMERRLTEDKSLASVARIKRAALNMQHMTETLLWLSRDDDKEKLSTSKLNITDMLSHLIEDNQYLLQGKTVKLNINMDNELQDLAATPCRLILNNLIRNAFQYTAEGTVNFSFKNSKLIIENINIADGELDYTGSDYGYGLGLRLVDKIIHKMHWQYENIQISGGRKVVIQFSNK
ncbi:sensor histidine kinase [Pseudoalteromonas denitrificans]|uniref:histidine kinase n=1 Tax=Pseudoalteromonas denitrificans DSM 6059 TaxID=1123010 RepID=A0A1I1KUB9_9GAMM|nr:HAMP domain-containing sensor histidine kinase [Pseudoalteromonas denitrificans]SFC61733.1 Signal transduction histidine kinase [Pseudoalteromonas denitrificans DSM 6059]